MSDSELTIYDRMPNPLDAIKMLGGAIAKSRMFGCETPEQGMIMAWECLTRRLAPLSLKETYHLINTSKGASLTMRADAMLAGFLFLGGRHRVIERSEDRAAIELAKADGETQMFSCTFAEAQAAGFTEGKDGTKDNWNSPRQRMQMLWARVVSDGVRTMDPRVCAGKYTPEDFGQSSAADIPPMPSDGEVVTVQVTPDGPPTVATEEQRPTTTTVVTDSGSVPQLQTDAGCPSDAGSITDAQRRRIERLYEQLNVSPEVRDKALRSRNVNSLRNLSNQQAGEILAKLEAADRKAEIARQATQVGGESTLPAEATSALLTGPCSPEQVQRAKALIVEMQQMSAGTNVSAQIKSKLVASGLNTLADLSMGDMDRLLQQLAARNIAKWIESQLSKPVPSDDSGQAKGN